MLPVTIATAVLGPTGKKKNFQNYGDKIHSCTLALGDIVLGEWLFHFMMLEVVDGTITILKNAFL